MKLTIRNNSNNGNKNHELVNKHKQTIIQRLYKGAPQQNTHPVVQGHHHFKTQQPATMPNSKQSNKYDDPQEVSVSEFMLPHQQKPNFNQSQSMLLSGYDCQSSLLKSKRSESDSIIAKIQNFTHHFSIKIREVKNDRKNKIERSLTKQLYELKAKKQNHVDLQRSNSLMETAYFNGISQQANTNEEMCSLGLEGYYVRKMSKSTNKNLQQNYQRQLLKQEKQKGQIQRHSVARRIKTEIQLMHREQPEKTSSIYLHRQLKLVHKVQTERSLSSKDRQPGLIKRQNSQKDLLNWNHKNSYHSLNHNKYESSQEKLRMIRQQLHQIYSGTQMGSSGSSNIENRSFYYNSKKEKAPAPMNPRCKENMQDYYRSYLMQARNLQNNSKTLGFHRA